MLAEEDESERRLLEGGQKEGWEEAHLNFFSGFEYDPTACAMAAASVWTCERTWVLSRSQMRRTDGGRFLLVSAGAFEFEAKETTTRQWN